MYRDSKIPRGVVFGNNKKGRWVQVNSLGEVFFGDGPDEFGHVSSVQLDALCTRNQLRWPDASIEAHEDTYHPLNVFVEAESRRLLYEALPDKAERNAVRHVWDLQVVNDSRWRVYGGAIEGKPWAALVTEILHWVDDEKFWDLVIADVEELHGYVRLMREEPHSDLHYPANGIAGERQTKEPVRGCPGAFWFAGKEHGRPERQVELLWNVLHRSVAEVRDKIGWLEAETERLWKIGGVGVL